jgi:putative ABC transport system permease protein
VEIQYGRYLNQIEFDQGTASILIGYDNAEKLFGRAEKALGKVVDLRNKKAVIVGVIKKQGKSFIEGWQFDQSILLSYRFMKQMLFNNIQIIQCPQI